MVGNTKDRERRQLKERTSSRPRSRSPLSSHENSEHDENSKYNRKIRHPSSITHEFKKANTEPENLLKDRKSPLIDLGTTTKSRPNPSPTPSSHGRRSRSVSPSRVEQAEAAARYAAEHAIRIAGTNSQQYSPPSSPPKLTSPDVRKTSSSVGSTYPPKSSQLTSNASIPTTTSKHMANLPYFPNKENSLNALLNNGFGDTSVSRCPPTLPTNPLDSLSPGNPSGLTGALAAIQQGQSSIQQVLLHFLQIYRVLLLSLKLKITQLLVY